MKKNFLRLWQHLRPVDVLVIMGAIAWLILLAYFTTYVNRGANVTRSQASGTCDSQDWYCAGECAAQPVRDIFEGTYPGSGAAHWRSEKAANCGIAESSCGQDSCSVPSPTLACSPAKVNKAGACDPACCATSSDCPSDQSCGIPNGYCNSGSSCSSSPDPTTQQPRFVAKCIDNKCVWQDCTAADAAAGKCTTDRSNCYVPNCGGGGGGGNSPTPGPTTSVCTAPNYCDTHTQCQTSGGQTVGAGCGGGEICCRPKTVPSAIPTMPCIFGVGNCPRMTPTPPTTTFPTPSPVPTTSQQPATSCPGLQDCGTGLNCSLELVYSCSQSCPAEYPLRCIGKNATIPSTGYNGDLVQCCRQDLTQDPNSCQTHSINVRVSKQYLDSIQRPADCINLPNQNVKYFDNICDAIKNGNGSEIVLKNHGIEVGMTGTFRSSCSLEGNAYALSYAPMRADIMCITHDELVIGTSNVQAAYLNDPSALSKKCWFWYQVYVK